MVTDYGKIRALNWSSLKNVATSLRLYKWRTEHPRPETAALALGTAIHMRVLEPDRYAQEYAHQPPGLKLSTKEGKTWRVEQGGRTIIKADKAAVVEACAQSLADHGLAADLLALGRTEQTIRWKIDDVACKGRVDAVSRDHLIDLKTARSLEFFTQDSARHLYHAQLAWYRDGAVAAGMLDEDAEVSLIAVETSEPHDCAVYRLPTWVLEVGRKIYRRCLADLRVAEHTGYYPGRHPGIVDLDLPRWADPFATDYEEEL